MQVFYAPEVSGDQYILDERESKHTVKVLRMRTGDNVRLIDGKGNLFEGVISSPDAMKCAIKITGCRCEFEKRNYSLHIAISPLKNPDRFEWFIEKSVEIGIDMITPLICRNTEKKGFKSERINNIIISAMKQSLKAKLPVLNQPLSFDDFLGQVHGPGKRMIACCHENIDREKVSSVYNTGDALVLIGPEGDFSYEEVQKAIDAGFVPVHLGTSRLRTETAGVAACHSVYFINQ